MIHEDALKEIIKNRRDEASEVKDCYTKFAFQVLVLAAAFLGFIAQFYSTDNIGCTAYVLIWFTCGVVVLTLMCVSQIGCHKYSTANRHSGFELHINRTYDYEKCEKGETRSVESRIRQVGWEEAMCAWRVIQPIIFEEIYKKRTWLERRLFPLLGKERNLKNKYHWWDSEYLVNF